MTEYRAVLTGVVLTRPLQHLSYSLKAVSQWATTTLEQYPLGTIRVYISEERLIGTLVGKARRELVENGNCLDCLHTKERHGLTCRIGNQEYGACNSCECRKYRNI